jgi:peptidoglycan/LPS O-acetylase OafA/YrhL
MSLKQELLTWGVTVLSCGLALAMPIFMWRRLRRPETLREAWIYSRPGAVVACCVAGTALLAVAGVFMGILAITSPFLWATVALIAGALVAVVWFLVRYLAFDPRDAVESIAEPASDEPPT